MRRISLIVLIGAAILASAALSQTQMPSKQRPPVKAPGKQVKKPSIRPSPPPAISKDAGADETILAEWTFDNDQGEPDPQGWTTQDVTGQVGSFFHVDDFAGLNGGSFGRLRPLSGARSLWCGMRPTEDPAFCGYAMLPGYGNDWLQHFESVAFSAVGDVVVSYRVRSDTEQNEDRLYCDYLSKTGTWRTIERTSGEGLYSVNETIPEDSLNGSVRLRFTFSSDHTQSDEDGLQNTDGGAIIDDLRIQDENGLVDFQDFEGEEVGALATADGHWRASTTQYGDCAALFDGSTILQEDPLGTNATHLWGFFSGSTADYGCGGHPEQRAVPYAKWMPLDEHYDRSSVLYLRNRIVSPPIPAPGGLRLAEKILFKFKIYGDLQASARVMYDCGIRSGSGGCWGRWADIHEGLVFYDPDKSWHLRAFEIGDYIADDATEFQVCLEVRDMCDEFGASDPGDCQCHSHGPLFDSISVVKTTPADEFVVTNANPSGPGSLRQAILDANAASSTSTIRFDIPGEGPHTIDCGSEPLPTATAPVVIDGTSQPGYAGSPIIAVHKGLLVLAGGRSTIKGLRLSADPQSDGLALRSGSNVVRANVIESCRSGIHVEGDNNLIGGESPGAGNDIRSNATGVYVRSGTGNAIRGNSIRDNSSLGIDLHPAGVTANDAGDADAGANDLLNYPKLELIVYGAPGSVEGSVTGSSEEAATVDFYASPACDPSGHGEGSAWLGSTTVSLVPGVETRFAADLPDVPSGHIVTATLTDSRGSTSEFCECWAERVSRFVVVNTNEYGRGSLNHAITQANASSDLSTIAFNIPGPGPHTIPQSRLGLPAITQPVVIDGFSQASFQPGRIHSLVLIELRGHRGGLKVLSGACTIRGLAINGAPCGILVHTGSQGRVVIEGCLIGVNTSGNSAVPNGTGIRCKSSSVVIGGAGSRARNIISGNRSHGLALEGDLSAIISGNLIGVGENRTMPLGNGGAGVAITGNAKGSCTIGGNTQQAENVIAHNGDAGVLMSGSRLKDAHVRIVGNSIYDNRRLGIDLGNAGVTANDPRDTDVGPNALMNFPILSDAHLRGGAISLSGTLNSLPNARYAIQCYCSPQCDESGNGEGKMYLGGGMATTNSAGVAAFTFTLSVRPPVGWRIVTATATDAVGNTSEFSPCKSIVAVP